jgi:hypothetical protein
MYDIMLLKLNQLMLSTSGFYVKVYENCQIVQQFNFYFEIVVLWIHFTSYKL